MNMRGIENKRNKNNFKKAFSLVELMVMLIAISCVLAALSPVMVKKVKKSGLAINAGVGSIVGITTDCEDDYSSSCLLCKKDTKCLTCILSCSDGYYKDSDNCKCVSCTGINSNCNKCSSSSVCTSCSDGYYLSSSSACTICPKGYYCVDGNKTACPKGTYSSSTGLSSCSDCQTGKYASSKGSTSCTSCAKGTYASYTGSASCSNCEAGTYSNTTGSSSCTNCASGYYSLGGATSCTACSSAVTNCVDCESDTGKCTECASGYYLSSNTCIECPAGYYCDGSTTAVSCGDGYYAAAGSSSCSACSAKTSNCATCNSTSGSCSSCNGGYYINGSSCSICSAGYYCDGTTKTKCPKGTYSTGTGNSTCTSCASGYYQSSEGKTSCTKCSLPDNCSACDNTTGECSECDDGYKVNDGSCVKDSWCSTANGLVAIEEAGICVTQYNIGDHVNYPIPDGINVDIRTAGNSSSGISTYSYRCWTDGPTASTTTTCTDSDENTYDCKCTSKGEMYYCSSSSSLSCINAYSSCTRTLCNWLAASVICSNLSITIDGTTYDDWRLPTAGKTDSSDNELSYFADYSIHKCNDGLMLCGTGVNSGSPYCSEKSNSCYGSYDDNCYPHQVWSKDRESSIYAYYYSLNGSTWKVSGKTHYGRARSVRCVHDL